jgi:hypothetical protein
MGNPVMRYKSGNVGHVKPHKQSQIITYDWAIPYEPRPY